MEVTASTAASGREDSAAPPPTSPPPEEAALGERDEMEVEEYASASEEADGGRSIR